VIYFVIPFCAGFLWAMINSRLEIVEHGSIAEMLLGGVFGGLSALILMSLGVE
jgi:hypothetical protein